MRDDGMNPLVLIPARLASTRLPNKPLADIGGAPMIVHVLERALAAKIGDVAVACDSQQIGDAVAAAGGRYVLTDPDLPSGSDRIYRALLQIDPEKKYDVIINVQGDMPTLDPDIIRAAAALLDDPLVDIGTLAAVIASDEERNDPAVVKVVMGHGSLVNSQVQPKTKDQRPATGKALYFSRSLIPHGEGPHYHHIGIYAYRRAALETFVSLPPSVLEKAEKLEQLRALEAGMRLDVAVVDTVPLGVDTPEGLEKARKLIPALVAGSAAHH
ncbi:MAG: 3-deoxy-manno-octulosonate cytidylyltransferase [Alphaproteobacteria bacterium]|nr:3-deoxy-manno-octulosonate cytidylyltransferase [Alphaproteobacteria bacterium]